MSYFILILTLQVLIYPIFKLHIFTLYFFLKSRFKAQYMYIQMYAVFVINYPKFFIEYACQYVHKSYSLGE